MNDTVETLRNTPLGAELTDEEAAVLAALVETKSLDDGEELFKEGAPDDSLYVLLKGKLEVIKHTGAGDTASLAVLREGDLAGELGFVAGEAHSVGLRALSDCEVLSLKQAAFETIIDEHPRIVYKVMRVVARSAHKVMRRMNTDFIELSNYLIKQHGRY